MDLFVDCFIRYGMISTQNNIGCRKNLCIALSSLTMVNDNIREPCAMAKIILALEFLALHNYLQLNFFRGSPAQLFGQRASSVHPYPGKAHKIDQEKQSQT